MSQAHAIIDMLAASFGDDSDRHDVPDLIDRLNRLAGPVRGRGNSVEIFRGRLRTQLKSGGANST